MDSIRLPADTHIGYVHLQVAGLDEALAFYRDLLRTRLSRTNGLLIRLFSKSVF
jgi:catechol-2,3-dioxygenase